MMKKIAVTGSKGNLGSALVNLGAIPVEGDITSADEMRENIGKISPDVLIHCAGKSNVDWVHQHFMDANKINVQGTANVIDDLAFPSTKFICISSSHIFDGTKLRSYTENDRPNPKKINDYGLLKLGCEQIAKFSGAWIVRLSTMFSDNCSEIVKWMAFYKGDAFPIEIPTFYKRTYAHVSHIATGLMVMANSLESMPKILNISGTQNLSMYEFALAVAAHYGWDKSRFSPRRKEWKQLEGPESFSWRPKNAGLDVRLAKKYSIPVYSALQGIELLDE